MILDVGLCFAFYDLVTAKMVLELIGIEIIKSILTALILTSYANLSLRFKNTFIQEP